MNTVSLRADQLLRLFVTLLVLAYPAATLFINHLDSYTLILLALVGVWVWIRDSTQVWLNRDSGLLCLAFASLFVIIVLSYLAGYQTLAGFHFLGRYLRFLFIVPVYLAFRRYTPTAMTVFIGLALGALIGGIGAVVEFLIAHGSIRVDASTDLPIIFGDLATTMVLCAAAGFGLMAASKRSWAVPLLILCLAGGVIATLLSGTRGAWLPLFLLIPTLAMPMAVFFKRRHILAIAVIIIIAGFSSLYFVVKTDIQGRIRDAYYNTVDYFIALHMLHRNDTDLNAKYHCENDRAFLNAWANFFYTSNSGPDLDSEVVMDPLLQQAGICSDDYSVRLHNTNHDKWMGIAVPRNPLRRSPEQVSTMLVRGTGIFTLVRAKDAQIIYDSPGYKPLVLKAPNWTGKVIRIYLVPNATAWLVPIESYPGEYSFSIANTSVGKRFEMWRAAWQLFIGHPLLGVGTGAYEVKSDALIDKGEIAPFVASYDHPHNDYLDALSSRGILGFIALLAILVFPAVRFLRAMRGSERPTYAIGTAGVLTVAGFAIYALTDTIFLHSMMITWYVVYTALFYALLDTQADQKSSLKLTE